MSNFDVETSHGSSRNWCNYERLITAFSGTLIDNVRFPVAFTNDVEKYVEF